MRRSHGISDSNEYLDSSHIRKLHVLVGKYIDKIAPKRILDINPKMNPIIKFMSHCPKNVFMIDTRGELVERGKNPWSSKEVSCGNGLRSIQNVIPQTIETFIHGPFVQHFAAVVCMRCDSSHSPSWKDLMTLPRPFHLVVEFSNLHNYPITNKDGCSIVFIKRYEPSRTLTAYHCGDYPQDINRVNEAKKVLASSCDMADVNNTYIGMACQAEKLLLTSRINDSSLLAVNSLKQVEDEDMMML